MELYSHSSQQPLWRFITQLSYCQIWQNTRNHMIAQAYSIKNYEKTHARINRNKKYLVNTLGSVYNNKSNKTYLLIERIPSRLCQITTLNQSQTLKILHSTFKGLEQLQEIYGLLRISQSCICFNQSGNVKIWINPDLSSLKPIGPVKDNNPDRLLHIIAQIIQIAGKKCFNQRLLIGFAQNLGQRKIINFQHAAQQILKISQHMFIDIHDNLIQKLYLKSYAREIGNPNLHIQERDVTNQVKITLIGNKQSCENHSRKNSGHQGNHQRIYTKQCEKFKQNQDNRALQKIFYRSSHLSPNQSKPKQINNSQDYNKTRKSYLECRTTTSQVTFVKQNQQNSKQESSDFEDSFSRKQKYDERQILVSGQFQTFGILEDLQSIQNSHANKNSLDNQEIQNLITQQQKHQHKKSFDMSELDMQIKNLLSNKIQQGQNKIDTTPTYKLQFQNHQVNKKSDINQIKKQKICQFKKPNNKYTKINQFPLFELSNRQQKLLNNNDNMFKQNIKQRSTHQQSYLDLKYQQYVHNVGLNHFNKQKNTYCENRNQNSLKNIIGSHTKHTSNFEKLSYLNKNTNKFPQQIDSKNNLVKNNIRFQKYSGFRLHTEG